MIKLKVKESELRLNTVYRLLNRYKFHGYVYVNGVIVGVNVSQIDGDDPNYISTLQYDEDCDAWDYYSEDNPFKFGR